MKSAWIKNAIAPRRIKPRWQTLLSAALIVFAFPPWGFSPLIWVALVPWFLVLRRQEKYYDAFIQGVWLSFFMSIGGFSWVAYVLKEFGNLPWAVAIFLFALYSLAGQPQFLVFGPLYRWIWKSRKTTPGLFHTLLLSTFVTFAYTSVDWCLPKLFADTLGHSFFNASWMRQSADLGGPFLLTFLVVFTNHCIANAFETFRQRREPSLWPAFQKSLPEFFAVACLIIAALVYGSHQSALYSGLSDKAPQHLQAAVIQANIGDFDKVAAERGINGAAERILDTYTLLSDQALSLNPKPDVLIWPETAYPSTFRTPSTAADLARDQRVERFVKSRQVPLLFGGYDHQGLKDFNAFFFLSPAVTNDLQVYRKNILLLFGEYIPGADEFKWIQDAFPQVGNFGRGIGPEVLNITTPQGETFRAGPVICYEVLFPAFVREAVRKGSEIILNITNDSWFGPYGEPELHLALSIFRSVENRIPLLRATNTGISALVTPDGEIKERTPIDEARIMSVSVPIIAPAWTLSKAWGEWFGPFCVSIFAAWFLMHLLFSRRNKTDLSL
jgi:apolipoprotein N-acyltransferase